MRTLAFFLLTLLCVFPATVMADVTTTVTTSSPGVQFAVNDLSGKFWTTSSGLTKPNASSTIVGSDFHLYADGTAYTDAGIVLYFDGSLKLGDLESVSVNSDNPGAMNINLWIDTGGDGKFFSYDSNGLWLGLNSDSYGSYEGASVLNPASTPSFYIGPAAAHDSTVADLKAAYPNAPVAIWAGITNTHSADISSIDVKTSGVTPVPEIGSVALLAIMLAIMGLIRFRLWQSPKA